MIVACADAKGSVRMAWLADDARIVAAGREHESHIRIGQKVDLVHRFPRGHMVAFSGHDKDRNVDVG